MVKKILMLAQLLLAAFLVKFLDADSGGSDSDSDSGGSDSGSADSDSGSLEGSSAVSGSSSETADWSDSGDSNSQSSPRKKPLPRPEDLSNLPFGDLSQIPRRDDNFPDLR